MFFEDLAQIGEIACRVGASLFVVPDQNEIFLKDAIVLKPESRTIITIEQIRTVLNSLTAKQSSEKIVLIRPADKMSEEAENAILKSLEEPNDNVHFVLVSSRPSKLLPTILSRLAIYIWRGVKFKIDKIDADEKTKKIAKELLAASDRQLVALADKITAKKDGVRDFALEILTISIEMAYKSYLLTKKPAFLAKIPKFIKCYENIAKNGHVKLHLVADLL